MSAVAQALPEAPDWGADADYAQPVARPTFQPVLNPPVEITPDLIKFHGLTGSEYEHVLQILGRVPTLTELGVISVMWSEHCSYKSSKPILKRFPTQGKRVVQGPGENAGILDIGDGWAVCFKIESHNHPSAVEPYQGAATGVGGILRDIFTMGARPVAMVDPLRFGNPKTVRTRMLAGGVIAGIAEYGNCVGVPTIAGETHFHDCYEENILVNVLCVGLVRHDQVALGHACTPGYKVVYFGNSTGRDGMHGATFASVELSDQTKGQRSAVQVGDPFMGKKILEASLELIHSGAVEGIQDMGAAGLTCSSCEMAGRGGTGMRLNLNQVPLRAENLTPYEIMLSESQERMLCIVAPEKMELAERILNKWEVGCFVVGEVMNDGILTVLCNGEEVARIPAAAISNEAPVYNRPTQAPLEGAVRMVDQKALAERSDLNTDLLSLLSDPNFAVKDWTWRQYDHQVQTNTVVLPGGDAAVIRARDAGPDKFLAISADGNGAYCALNPYRGGMIAVAEAARNVVAVGAQPIGITNCLNFANPEKPDIFYYFEQVCAGMAEACRAFNTPVTGGNVSFYNESYGKAIFPTPVIGMIGLIEKSSFITTAWFKNPGDLIFLVGPAPKTLGGSAWLQRHALPLSEKEREEWEALGPYAGRVIGPCPELDLAAERASQIFVLDAIRSGLIESCHDISDGGLAIAAAECCLIAPSPIGAVLDRPTAQPPALVCFSEDQSRFLISAKSINAPSLHQIAEEANVSLVEMGRVGGDTLRINNWINLPLWELEDAWRTDWRNTK
ncbi:MAG: phosphoribosylformylglycinamidine synthase subunit PurL [Candidatus Sumerlaeota bacterium]|nr:phosphoribosylformylglycinamidine synthase subunit PurL [Candidatus Sumerlaeota bacterium]